MGLYPPSQQSLISAIQHGMLRQEDSCDGKVKYPTHALAQKVANRRQWEAGVALRVYLCPFCGQHHLTKRPD